MLLQLHLKKQAMFQGFPFVVELLQATLRQLT
jgi:hypothetical protein